MRALRCDGAAVRLWSDLPTPTPAPGKALVHVRRAGVSPADMLAAHGGGSGFGGGGFAGTLGHEFVGVVERIDLPEDAPPSLRGKRSLLGQRVTASINILCGQCTMCRSGLSPHCRNRAVVGVTRDGCFAEFIRLPLANLVPVPESVDDDAAVFAHPLACAVHAAHMAGGGGSTAETGGGRGGKAFVTVLGDGVLALLTAAVLSKTNPGARLLSAGAAAPRVCERWSVRHRHVDEAGRRQDQDVVIDCTGSAFGGWGGGAGVRLAMQLVRPRGMVVLTSPATPGVFAPGSPWPEAGRSGDDHPGGDRSAPVDLTPLVANEVRLVGSRDGPLGEALGMLERREVEAAGLITGRFGLDDGVAALAEAARPDSLKIVIDP